MRVLRNSTTSSSHFANYLLKIGEGSEPTFVDNDGTEHNINIPSQMLYDKNSKYNFIKHVFPSIDKG